MDYVNHPRVALQTHVTHEGLGGGGVCNIAYLGPSSALNLTVNLDCYKCFLVYRVTIIHQGMHCFNFYCPVGGKTVGIPVCMSHRQQVGVTVEAGSPPPAPLAPRPASDPPTLTELTGASYPLVFLSELAVGDVMGIFFTWITIIQMATPRDSDPRGWHRAALTAPPSPSWQIQSHLPTQIPPCRSTSDPL